VGLFETVKGGGKKDPKAPKPAGPGEYVFYKGESVNVHSGGAVQLFFVSVSAPPGSEDQLLRLGGGCASLAWVADLKFHRLASGNWVRSR
jgi:hypothetical protein